MATYTTQSGFSDLVGSVDITNDDANSYTSTTLGETVIPQNLGPTGLRFKVDFGGRTYNINATANPGGNGYTGSANNNSPLAGQESWSATASTVATDDAAAQETAYGLDDDAASKTAAS